LELLTITPQRATSHEPRLVLAQREEAIQQAVEEAQVLRDTARQQAMEEAVRHLQQLAAQQPEVLLTLPAGRHLTTAVRTQVDVDYLFLRENFTTRVFNAAQTQQGLRSQHRKTHLVTWRVQHALTERLQPEAEVVYQAFRQHTYSDGDLKDRNDDGDFERLLLGISYQVVRESPRLPAVRWRSGVLIPSRADSEGIGQETGLDVLLASSKSLGAYRVVGALGFAMTFDNHAQPSDSIFNETATSKGHDLRTLTYGVGVVRPLGRRLQANVELSAKHFDTVELNRRRSDSAFFLTPGLVYRVADARWDSWIGLGIPCGLTSDSPHLGIAIRTGARF